MRVLLVAEEAAGLQVLRRLAARDDVEVAAVLTAAAGRSRGATVGAAAAKLELPVLDAGQVRDAAFGAWVEAERVDVLLNVHSLYVVDEAVLRACRVGAFNVHPGPLPHYAGLNAPSWAIVNGESEHAVTIHWMEAGIDTGAIAYETRFPLADDDTGLSVSAACVRHALPLVDRLLDDLRDGTVPAIPQDLARRRYFGPEPPNGGRIDWETPAAEVVAFVRACDYGPFPSPWGRPLTAEGGRELAVLAAAITGEPNAEPPGTVGPAGGVGVQVAAADEWVLVERVAVAGEAVPPAAALEPSLRLG